MKDNNDIAIAGNQSAEASGGYNFGTFKGVFTPSILTILGVIMYLRFGWVLGNVGLFWSLVIATLASGITFLTGLSLSSLATNMRVGGGGSYFIISRSLGVELGAAIGLPLFFAQALGVSFYIVGFSESVVGVFPYLSVELVGVVTLLVLTFVAYTSANLALRLQYIVMTFIVLSLISFFMGDAVDPAAAEIIVQVPKKQAFWVVFAVFFPAVTGIEAGIALSGDLKHPGRSLPVGTLAAVSTGYLIYIAIFIALYFHVPDDRILLTNSLVMSNVARWGSLIMLGIWGASLSSAMGTLLGSPRTLQALAQDRVLPGIIGRGYGKNRDPRIATVIVFCIALTGVLLGDLNKIAPLLTMFFLTSYGIVNLSAGFEGLISSPSWRPKFKVSWKLSFLGALGCFLVMFMINPGASFIALGVACSVYYVMQRRSLIAQWNDIRSGILMLGAQYSIQQLDRADADERTWKPNVLVLSGAPTSRWYLVELGSAISRGRSLMTVATVLPEQGLTDDRVELAGEAVRAYLRERDIEAVVKVLRAKDVFVGLEALVTAYGYGPIIPNTIILGKSEEPKTFPKFVRLIDLICRKRRNLVIVGGCRERGKELESGARIDVWWARESENAGLMLALAHQLRRSSGWKDARLIIKTVVVDPSEEVFESAHQQLKDFIKRERLDAEALVVKSANGEIFEDIKESSAGASLVFLGMRAPTEEESLKSYTEYYRELLRVTKDFPPTSIVYAAENIEFQRIFST